MKKIKKGSMKMAVAVTALLMLQSFVVLAQTNVQLALYKTESKVALLKVEDIKQGEFMTVTIRNENGAVLFIERGIAEEYIKLLDFAKLGNGTYLLDIAQSKGMVRKVVVKEDSGLFVKKENLLFSDNITIKDEDKKLFVRFSNGLMEPVTMRITDSEGHILHEQTNIVSENYAAMFNLSKLTRGQYSMSLTSGYFSKSKSFELQ